MREFAPTTIKKCPDWFVTAMLGSSSSGNRPEFPVTLKLFVNLLEGSWDKETSEVGEPNIAAAWDESRIVVLLSRLLNRAHKPPDNTSLHVRGVSVVWVAFAPADTLVCCVKDEGIWGITIIIMKTARRSLNLAFWCMVAYEKFFELRLKDAGKRSDESPFVRLLGSVRGKLVWLYLLLHLTNVQYELRRAYI